MGAYYEGRGEPAAQPATLGRKTAGRGRFLVGARTRRGEQRARRRDLTPTARLLDRCGRRSVCHRSAPRRRNGGGPLYPTRRSGGDKSGRRRRPRLTGQGRARLKGPPPPLLPAAPFLGCFSGPDERGHYAGPQPTPLLVDRRVGFGPRVAVEQQEGFLAGVGHRRTLSHQPRAGVLTIAGTPAFRVG